MSKPSVSIDDAHLDEALASLPSIDVDPLHARALAVAAKRRLGAQPKGVALAGWGNARESLLLCVLSAAQVLWAAARVLALLR